MNSLLTDAVVTYQETGEDWPALSERINRCVYDFPFKHTSWDHDRCCDFYIAFLPKIPGLVKRYRPINSFETYLYTCLKWYMKTFTEYLAAQEYYDNWAVNEGRMAMENLAEYHPSQTEDVPPKRQILVENCPFKTDGSGRLKNKVFRTRILAAILVYASDIETAKIPALSVLTGVEQSWLENALEKARNQLSQKIERRKKLRGVLNECWYNMEWVKKRMYSDSTCEQGIDRRWEKKYEYWNKRHLIARKALSSLTIRLSLHEVGQIMSLPAGTVASGLYFLRKYWTEHNSKG